jgi:hypothetical protein
MTKAYEEGLQDKRAGILEPTPDYSPGTKGYSDYADGYLSEPFSDNIYIGEGDHHVNF